VELANQEFMKNVMATCGEHKSKVKIRLQEITVGYNVLMIVQASKEMPSEDFSKISFVYFIYKFDNKLTKCQ